MTEQAPFETGNADEPFVVTAVQAAVATAFGKLVITPGTCTVFPAAIERVAGAVTVKTGVVEGETVTTVFDADALPTESVAVMVTVYVVGVVKPAGAAIPTEQSHSAVTEFGAAFVCDFLTAVAQALLVRVSAGPPLLATAVHAAEAIGFGVLITTAAI